MATENQKRVVEKTLEKLGNNEILNKGDILEEIGYSEATTKNPQTIYDSKGVKEQLEPVLNQLIKKRQQAIDNLGSKIDEAKYRDLTDAIDKFTKNIQLLSGGETERQKIIVLPAEAINKYESSQSTSRDSK